ncbi:MAG: DNA mismatch repair endonuclease MutL [Synergistetes bacterium]|nr:DNA mismatch repair endonuclease MutL [Synergistota bacterium]
MRRILKLPQEVVAKIAAGEVVERPASVVKELVENALDAFSKEIRIYAKEGGKDLIKVSDDGVGIPASDVELAFERHATSKISALDDLTKLETLGFRGEALPSIAAVSKVELITKAQEEDIGTRIIIEGGKKVFKENGFFRQGTTITVRSLFYNLPLRRKLLKSSSTEWNRILKIVLAYILAFPEVRFYLYKGEELFLSSGTSLEESLKRVFGGDFLKNMRQISFAQEKYSVSGFVSAWGEGSGEFFIFVNNRPVKSDIIKKAVAEALSIPPGRFPVRGFIKINVNPSLIDQNVHPAKLEVRFFEPGAVYSAVYNAIRRAFSIREPSFGGFRSSVPKFSDEESSLSFKESLFEYECKIKGEEKKRSPIRVLARTSKGYFLAETEDGIWIIDPHALLERLLFERLRNTRVTVQLIAPIVLHYDSYLSSVIKDKIEVLKEVGFELEEFGGNAFLLRGVPSPLSNLRLNWGEAIKSLFKEGSLDLIKAWADLACHAAPKLGDIATPEDMQRLLNELYGFGDFDLCPHGRPIRYFLSYREIAKWLGR